MYIYVYIYIYISKPYTTHKHNQLKQRAAYKWYNKQNDTHEVISNKQLRT